MATALLYIGWNRPVAGKETEAWKYFMEEGDAALTKFQKQGHSSASERVALTPHSGTVNGFLLLFGERAKLDELRRTDEFERFSISPDRRCSKATASSPASTTRASQKAMARTKDLMT